MDKDKSTDYYKGDRSEGMHWLIMKFIEKYNLPNQ